MNECGVRRDDVQKLFMIQVTPSSGYKVFNLEMQVLFVICRFLVHFKDQDFYYGMGFHGPEPTSLWADVSVGIKRKKEQRMGPKGHRVPRVTL